LQLVELGDQGIVENVIVLDELTFRSGRAIGQAPAQRPGWTGEDFTRTGVK
jgi:hypothetical protein